MTGALHAVWRRGVLVLLVALVICALAVTLDALLRGPAYTAEALVRVQRLDEAEEESSRRWLEETLGTAGPAEIARSAATGIGWEDGFGEFRERLELDIRSGGELRVRFSSSTPEGAAEAANAYAETFVGRMEELGEDRLAGGALGATAEVAREAQPPQDASRARPLAVGLLALFPGLLAGGALALWVERRDRRWPDAREAELTLGAPVLGVIPERGSLSETGSEEESVVRRP